MSAKLSKIRMREIDTLSSRKRRRKEMKYIPQEIIEEILLRLPIKSIIQTQLVCKLWRAISFNASFKQKHLNFVNKNPGLYLADLCHRYPNIESFERGRFKSYLWTPKQVKDHEGRLVGSCNGLICMFANEQIVVFNPAIRESISLPNPSIGKSQSRVGQSWLAKWNFAFNPIENEYKVIHFYEQGDRDLIQCGVEVFTLGNETNSWRQIEGGVSVVPRRPAINIGAAMYWEVQDNFHYNSVTAILFFDMSQEKFGRIEAPSPKEEYDKSLVMDLNGRLCWVSISLPSKNRVMKLWTLDNEFGKNKSNWTLLHTIQLSKLIPCQLSSLRFCYLKNSQIMIQLVSCNRTVYYCFDFAMKNDGVEFLSYMSKEDPSRVFRTTYVESFVSLS